MRRTFSVAVALFAAGATLAAQQDPPKQQGVLTPAPQQGREVIRPPGAWVPSGATARDDQGKFVSSLSKNDFDVYEDGVKQDLVTFVLTRGGRVINDISAPPPPLQAGILLPPPRPTNDASGRIFLIFVDDLPIGFNNTRRIRDP